MNKEEKERILQCVLSQIEKERIPRNRYRLRKVGAIAMAAVIVFSCGAFTVKALDLDSRLERVLGGNSEKIARAVANLDAVTEDKGLRIQAKQAVGDGHRVYVLLEVASLTGLTFDESCGFEGFDIACSRTANFGASVSPANDAVSENGKRMDMLLEIASEEPANKQEISLNFENLVKNSSAGEDEREVLIEGQWNLDFQLRYKKVSETYRPHSVFTLGKGKLRVDRIDLSPISCFIEVSVKQYSSDLEDAWSNLGDIKLKMKNGTLVPLEADGCSWISDGADSSGTMEGVFREIIDMDQVEKLVINDMEMPLY
ncbi:DUF4179 domain-containing protein [bacterium 210820-DFI.6.37]|nr:DUF4179 domain-containing protein [bacterium 210820-DFI.6.37]